MTTYRPPMCISCKYMRRKGLTCDAFPKVIPNDILESRFDHRQPYTGDKGKQYVPVSEVAAKYVDQIFNTSQEGADNDG